MIELEPYFFDSLRIAKRLWDENLADRFLDVCGDLPVDTEEYYEIAMDGIYSVFEQTRNYYNEHRELETIVCFDPLIDKFFELCEVYEDHMGLTPEENSLRLAGSRAIYDSFGFLDYTCDWWFCSEGHGRPRLVVLWTCEFCGLHILPVALASAKSELERQIKNLEVALKKRKKRKPVIRLPEQNDMKEAA